MILPFLHWRFSVLKLQCLKIDFQVREDGRRLVPQPGERLSRISPAQDVSHFTDDSQTELNSIQ